MNHALRLQVSCANQVRFIITSAIVWLACISLAWLPPDRLELLPAMLQAVVVGSAFAVVFCLPVPLGYLALRLALTEREYLREHVASTVVAFVSVAVILTLYFFLALPHLLRSTA